MQCNFFNQQLINAIKIRSEAYQNKYEALVKICEVFRENHIDYAISFSLNLFLLGIVTTFNDIDIAVRYHGGIRSFKEILISNGIKINFEKLNGEGVYFPTNLFLNCSFNDVQIEIYVLDFETDDLHFINNFPNLKLPLLPIEEMYIKYSILEEYCPEERRYKRILIEEYLKKNGISRKKILYEAINGEGLSLWIKKNIQEMLINN